MAPPQTTGPVSRLLLQRNPRDWVIWKRQVWPSETAWQGLFERAQLQAGERVLIHGGSGEVGIYAIQPARRAGAHVITTASARNFDLLSQLGANEMIDYRTDRFEDRASNLDVVFETVGGETLKRSWGLLKSQGRMVTLAAESEGTKDERIERALFIVEPNQKELMKYPACLPQVSFNASSMP